MREGAKVSAYKQYSKSKLGKSFTKTENIPVCMILYHPSQIITVYSNKVVPQRTLNLHLHCLLRL